MSKNTRDRRPHRSLLSFLTNLQPEAGTVPIQSRVTLASFYIILPASVLAVLPTIADNFASGGVFIGIMQAVYLLLVILGITVMLITRRLSHGRIILTAAVLVIVISVIADAGGVRGMGLMYFIAGYPILYFLLGFRGGVILPGVLFFGVAIRLLFGDLNPASLFTMPDYRTSYIIILGVASLLGTFAVFYQHILVKHLSDAAYKDDVTGLYNRRSAEDMLGRLLNRRHTGLENCSAVAVKLHQFARINSHHGTDHGDDILRIFATRFAEVFPQALLISRYTGTVFLAITREHDGPGLDALSEGLIAALQQPIEIDSGEFTLQGNVIITRYPEDGTEPEQLISNIMTSIARAGKNPGHVLYYDEKAYLAERRRYLLGEELRHAVQNNEFKLVYHPKVSLADEQCQGAEILLRWKNQHYGMVPPDQFIPIAEEIGVIQEITQWVAQTGLEQLGMAVREIPEIGRSMTHAINLSPLDLSDPHFEPYVTELARAMDFPAHLIEFEITERVLMDQNPRVQKTIEQIRRIGFRLAIDDFGTGYSSLSYLHRLQINTLKIDKSFINQLDGAGNAQTIINAIISMAHSLDLDVIAEGVETSQQAEYLREQKCRYAQGWLYAKPMNIDDYITWLKNRRG